MAKKNVDERFNKALEEYRNPEDKVDNSRAESFSKSVQSFQDELSGGRMSGSQIAQRQSELDAQAKSLAQWASENQSNLRRSFEGIGGLLGAWNDTSRAIKKWSSTPLPNYGWNREAPEMIAAAQTGTIGETPDVMALRDAASRLALGGADSAFKPYEDFYKMKNTPLDVAVGRADDFKRLAEYQSRANGLDGNTRYSSLTREEFQDYTALMDKYHLDTDSLRDMPFDKMAQEYAQQATNAKLYHTASDMEEEARNDPDFEKLSREGLKWMDRVGTLGDFGDQLSVLGQKDVQLALMSDDQKAIYGYYLAKNAAWQPDGSGDKSLEERKALADQYYHSIAEDIAYRYGQGVSEANLERLGGGKAAELANVWEWGLAGAYTNMISGAGTLLGAKNNEAYYSPTATGVDVARSESLQQYAGDSVVRKAVGDLVMNTANQVPQILTSYLIGALGGGLTAAGKVTLGQRVASVAGSVATMGVSVYGQSYDEARRLGMDTTQAGVYGVINSASELALGELLGGVGKGTKSVMHAGLERLMPKVDSAVLGLAGRIGKTAVGKYMMDMGGEFLEEYLQDALEPWFRSIATGVYNKPEFFSADALYSGLLGALSAGLLNVSGMAEISDEFRLYKKAGAQIKRAGTVGQLKSIASTFSADAKAYQLAEKLTEDSKPSEIGKVLKAVGAALSDQNVASMSAYLQEKYKLPKDSADKLIGFFRDYCKGAELSDEGLELLDVNDEITEAFLSEIVGKNVSGARKNAALQALAQNTNFAEDMHRPEQEFNRRNTAFMRFMADTMGGKSSTDMQSAVAEESSASKKNVGTPAAVQQKAAPKETRTVDASKTGVENVREWLNNSQIVDKRAVDTLVNSYESAGGNQDVLTFVRDAELAYTYGKYNMNEAVETAGSPLALTEEQAKQARSLGKMFGWKESVEKQAAVSKENGSAQPNRGTVRFEYDAQNTRLTAREQTSVDVLSALAQAYNLKLSFFESTMEDGKRVYKTQDGKTVSAPNGYYTSSDGTIHIDVHAGQAGQGVVMYTAAHELTHYIAAWDAVKFRELANFLVEQYGKAGQSVSSYVARQMEKAERQGRTLSYDEAFEEFVADSMETMLADGRVAEKLRALKEKDKTLWQKVKDFFKDFAANLKKLVEQYKDAAPDSEEGKFVASLNRDVIEKLEDLFTEGVVTASENSGKAGSAEGAETEVRNSNRENDSEYKKPITPEDVSILRSIGRKSINRFTSEDIQKAQKWAYKFYQELGTKSPFFRAWFGDWRARQTEKMAAVAEIPAYIPTNEARKTNRGIVRNADTNWDIRISREGETNTISHSGQERLSEYGLAGIRGLIENAVLLDSEVHEHHSSNAQNDLIAFDHKLYALGSDTNRNIALYKITVEEAYHDSKRTNDRAFHNLKYIKKVATVGGRTASQSLLGVSTSDNVATTYSIADLYSFVKRYDKDFTPAREVSSALLNEDGTPKIFYHGTRANFTEFLLQDKAKFGRALGDGFYFTPNYEKAFKFANGLFSKGQDRGGIIMQVYLQMEDPYVIERDADRTKWKEEYNKGAYDGIIDLKNETYFVEKSTQIKSATDNIGTFDRSNPDIRFSARENYSYDALTDKPPMEVTVLDTNVPANRADVVKTAKQNAASVGKLNKDGSVSVFVKDIGKEIILGTPGLKHGLSRMTEDNVFATVSIGKILANSIQVNEIIPKKESASGGRILIGMGVNPQSGKQYCVRSVVNTFTNELESVDVLYAINAKGLAALNAPRATAKPLPVTNPTISIADLLAEVNNHFPQVLSMDVLNTLGHTSRPDGDLGKDVVFSDRDPNLPVTRAELAEKLMELTSNPIEEERLTDYIANAKNLDKLQAKLQKLNSELKKLPAADKATDKATKEKIEALRLEAQKTANRLDTYERKLVNLEATAPIKALMQRQSDRAYQRGAQMAERLRGKYTYDRMLDIIKRVGKKLDASKNTERTKEGVRTLAETVVSQSLQFFDKDTGMDAKTMLMGIANMYAELKDSMDTYIEDAYKPEVHLALTELAADLAGATRQDLTTNELQEMYNVLRAVETSINKAGYLFGKESSTTVRQAAEAVVTEMQAQKQAKPRLAATKRITDFVSKAAWADMKPIYAIRTINSPQLTKMFNELLYDGQNTWIRDINRGAEFMQEAAKKYNFEKWDHKARHEYTDKEGQKISLSLEQMMYIYALIRRGEQAINHLYQGGFVFAEDVTTDASGKRIAKDPKAHQLTTETMEQIRNKLKTDYPEAARFVEDVQEYLSTVLAKDGNEVSYELYGLNAYGEKNYIPIHSAGDFHARASEVQFQKELGFAQGLANRSFTKRTVRKASNPILLSNFSDVASGHISDMAQYHAFAVPLTNLKKVMAWSERAPDVGGAPESVRSAIRARFGSDAPVKYLDNLINDLNASPRRDPTETVLDKGLSTFKRSAVVASASVAIQQPSAIARTLYVMNPLNFLGAKVEKTKLGKTWDQLCAYSSTAAIKDMGGFDVGMSGSTADYIFGGAQTKGEKIKAGIDAATGFAPEYMDKVTWCTIWNAVKRETKRSNPGLLSDSEEFLKKAGRRFDEVVNLTQVYDSTLTKSQAMRSRSTYMKMITAFMAEPTTSINMLADGFRQGGKTAVKAVATWTASALLNSLLASLVYAGRDDDDEKTWVEKYAASFADEMKDAMNPLTAIPLVQDLWNICQGWDVERSDMSVFADIVNGVRRVAQRVSSGKEIGWKDYEETILAAVQALGLPLKNISRDLRAVVQTITSQPLSDTQWYEILSGALPSLFPADKSAKLYYAITSGNTEYAERLRGTYKDDVAYHTGIRTALADTDPRIVQAAKALDDGDLEEYKRLVNAIKSMGFIQDDVVSAVNNKYNEMHKDDSEREFTEGKVSMYKAEHYVASVVGGLGMEDEIFNEIVRAYLVKNADKGYSKEDAEGNVRKSLIKELKEAYVDTGVLDRTKAKTALQKWMSADKAEETLKQWDYSKSVGAEWNDRYTSYYEAITDGTGDASKIKAEILKAGVEEKYIQQAVVDRVKDDYSSDRMTAAEAQKLLKQYGGLEAEEAQTKINVWDYMGRHPDSALQADDVALFYDKYKAIGVPEANFEKYLLDVRACKGEDKDGDGKADSGTKKAQILKVINELPVSDAVKDALYYDHNWAASKIYEAPWH